MTWHARRSLIAHPKADPQQLDTLAPLGRLHRLFRSTSWQHMLVEGQIGDELLELTILLFKLAEPAQLRYTHPRKRLLPALERLLADPEFAADLGHRCPRFCLPKRVCYLHLCENRFPHLAPLICRTF
jgi:hypothetical protein